MYGIADLDNCYCSCEKVFRPDLEGKPIVVLSNNDGCVVARSNEAKAMGIKEGTPYFQLAQQFPNQKIAVFSSNYELYGELTGRVVIISSKETPAYFRYSIDECFMYLDRINRMNGSETVVIGAQQYTRKDGNGKAAIEREKSRACSKSSERKQARPKVKADVFANAIKHDFKSKNPTTRWADVIKLH